MTINDSTVTLDAYVNVRVSGGGGQKAMDRSPLMGSLSHQILGGGTRV